MDTYTDGLYEIEFQRAYRIQGLVLRRIIHLEKQRDCYNNKMLELASQGIFSPTLRARIELTNDRLRHFTKIRDQIEDYKDEISVNNPTNFERTHDARIINSAYERAYAPVGPLVLTKVPNGLFGCLFGKLAAMRQK